MSQDRRLKVPILCSAALSLCGAGLWRLPQPPRFIFRYVASDSLLGTSYLAERGPFPICRVAAMLRSPVEFVGVQNDVIAL